MQYRTGSGDAIVDAILRKLTTCPPMFENQDVLERQLHFAIAAGIIAQWTIGVIRGFPTESLVVETDNNRIKITNTKDFLRRIDHYP